MFKLSPGRAAVILLATALSAGAQATTVSYSSNVIPLQPTDFDYVLDLQQFDPSLGTLLSVSIELDANALSTMKAETRSTVGGRTVLKLLSDVTLYLPDTTPIANVGFSLSRQFFASAYDGTLDFGGTSGHTFANIVSAGSDIYNTAVNLGMYIGNGQIHLPVSTLSGTLAMGGGGALTSQFRNQVGTSATITYNYAPVPEPSAMAMLFSGILALGWMARRRQS